MRALWIDEGNNPDWDKIKANQMTALFFHMFDPRVTQTYLMNVRLRGYTPGVYVAWNWPQVSGGADEFVEKVSDRLDEIVPITSAQNFPKVQLNVELHDPLWIQNMVVGWRKLRPYRDTSWTMEPMQGGWMSPNMVQAVISRRVRVSPQIYYGDMTPADEQTVIQDLVIRGFPRALISPSYDAALITPSQDGFFFTQGRLP